MVAMNRSLDVRWIRRYRLFLIGGGLILVIQIFLAYIFFALETSKDNSTHEYLSGRGRLNVEVIEDHNSVESSRRFRDHYIGQEDDEEDGIGNSNGLYGKVKVPPDRAKQVPNKAGASSLRSSEGNKTVLRLEELDFAPLCEIKGKEAISAIHRARSQHCKQMIANTTCLISSGALYPAQLPHLCPAPGLEKGRSLGCFQDDKSSRLLPGFYQHLKTTNSPQTCIQLCTQAGFSYAGVQYGSECFCGSSEPPSSAKVADSRCNMKCPLDPRLPCGGFYTANIYQTGIAKVSKETAELDTDAPAEESPARILFLLTLNGRSLRQVKRLIKALYHTQHFFYLHVDARQDYLMRELTSLETSLRNVRLCRRRAASIWGGASLLSVLLSAMTEMAQGDWSWDFVINLSESDYPVKTNEELVRFLTAHKGRNFVKSHGREVQRFIQKQGLDKSFVECDAHMWRIGDRQLPHGIVVDGGSDWFALSRPFVDYLATHQTEPLLQGLVTLFRHTLLPAESFFHTALRNSPHCRSYVDNNLHVTNWRRRLGCKCQYKHVVDWCGCSPNNFRLEDWPRLQGTKWKAVFFARKFEPVIDQSIINQVDSWLYGPYPPKTPGLESYWECSYSSSDLGPRPDDALLSLGLSLARTASRRLSLSNNCTLSSSGRLFELTSYHKYDAYMGSLVLYEAAVEGGSVRLETWARPLDHWTVLEISPQLAPLKRVEVTSDYDQKEWTARNWARALGPFSEPVAVYRLSQSVAAPGPNLTLLWVDPLGALADLSHLHIGGEYMTGFVRSSLKAPLLPGLWTLRVLYNGRPHAEALFLVCPLELLNGTPLTPREAQFVHRGPSERYRHSWEELGLRASLAGKSRERRAAANSRRTGRDLHQWIDSLVPRFYEIVDTCRADGGGGEWCGLVECSRTSWSSLSPDPKSQITALLPHKGTIKRW